MLLHKILMRHAGPKSQVEFTLLYVFADSEQAILDRLDKSGGDYTYGAWADRAEFNPDEHDEDERGPDDKRLFPIYDDGYKVIGHETYIQRMLRLRGEFHDENADWDDAYYGIKHYGWDAGTEVTEAQAAVLLELGIAVDWRTAE